MSRVMTLNTTTTATVGPPRGANVDALRIVSSAAARVHGWAAMTEGRRRTGQVLRALDEELWQVEGHVRLPDGSRAGHLVIGSSRAYVLDSRVWPGVVTVDHKGATITPAGHPEAAWTARGQHCSLAPAVAALGPVVSPAGTRLPAPRAVVVVWATFPERLALSGGITYVAGDRLLDWLSDQAGGTGRRLLPPHAGASLRARPARSLTWVARPHPGRAAAPVTAEYCPGAPSGR